MSGSEIRCFVFTLTLAANIRSRYFFSGGFLFLFY